MAARIAVKSPLVEIDGDEMARVMWHEVRDTLILPFVDVELQCFDLAHRGRLDGTPQVEAFASMLEASTIDVVESGCMTGDLARLIAPDHPFVSTAAFIAAVASSLRQRL